MRSTGRRHSFLFSNGTIRSGARLLPIVILAVLLLAGFCRSGCGASPSFTGRAARGGAEAEGCEACTEFNLLTTRVRDGEISRQGARQEMARLLPSIRAYYYRCGGRDYPADAWVFPLKGYDAGAIGSGRRHGYAPRGYDYFAGNRHGGHPSFDIFIRDRDQDERDDRTGGYVSVLSLTGGIVVALEPAWQPGSPLRGGKYVWVYDPGADALVYYAHNRQLFVGLGDMVRPGDLLAVVGRTGLNASRKRSPTHLHLTYLRLRGDVPLPVDIYSQLRRCRVE